MFRKMHTQMRSRSRRTGAVWAVCAVLLGGLFILPAAQAGGVADAPARVVVTTKALPANFAETLKDTGLVVLTQENLGGLGMVMFELRVDGDATQQNVFDRLQDAFPGHPFEWLKSDELDYEVSAF